ADRSSPSIRSILFKRRPAYSSRALSNPPHVLNSQQQNEVSKYCSHQWRAMAFNSSTFIGYAPAGSSFSNAKGFSSKSSEKGLSGSFLSSSAKYSSVDLSFSI